MPSDKPIIVSACLAGVKTRYDGGATPDERVMRLVSEGRAIPLCPEQLGGLPTPRKPYERVGDQVVAKDGQDVTDYFRAGAAEALRIAELAGCDTAILKSHSPSCGCGKIHDGTFTGTIVSGDGVFAEMLKARGLNVISEDELD